jgi:putative ABC transport system permease protein
MDALKESTRANTSGFRRQRLRGVFVVAQISVALVLLVGAGLMMNSFLRLYTVEVGFSPNDLMSFEMRFGSEKFLRPTGNRTPSGRVELELSEQINLISSQIRERLANVRGVQSATAIAVAWPLSGQGIPYTFIIDGRQASDSERTALTAQWFTVMPDYFRTLGVPVLRGREFSIQDSAGKPAVALISATMAQRFWPNENPIGQRIQLDFYNDTPREIIGVVGDIRRNSRDQEPQPQMYVPYAQLALRQAGQPGLGLTRMTFVVRASEFSGELVSAIRSEIARVDPTQAVLNFQPLEQYLYDQLQGFRQYVMLLAAFACVALTLTVVGIYGIMAHSVRQRTNEFGVRIALGATSRDIQHLVLRRGAVLIAAGLIIGLGASLALTRVISSVLWGITPTDPLTFILVVMLLSAVALLACYIPARRAVRTDPVIALK